MKQHVKLFEEFLLEEDPLAGLGLEAARKQKEKEDPFKKEKQPRLQHTDWRARIKNHMTLS